MRLGHMDKYGMTEIDKRTLLKGVMTCKINFYKYCVLEKQSRVQFKIATQKTGGILDYIDTNL